MPSIKKIKVIASPNIPKEKVKDMLGDGLHLLHRFEDEMGNHPFGHKLISIGKPMMMGGLHNVMDMMGGDTIPHLIHHLDHHPEHHFGCQHHHGPECCKDFVNNICKCVILFFIWKIFESIDSRCRGLSETQVIRNFRKDLQEQYGKINKVNSLLNESTLVLNEDHITAMKVNSLVMLSKDFNTYLAEGVASTANHAISVANNFATGFAMNFTPEMSTFAFKLVNDAQQSGMQLGPNELAAALAQEVIKYAILNSNLGQRVQAALTAKAKEIANTVCAKTQAAATKVATAVNNGVTDLQNNVTNAINSGNPNYIQAQRVNLSNGQSVNFGGHVAR